MIIRGAKVLTEDGVFKSQDICIDGEVFTSRTLDDQVIQADGLYAVPGLIDIHFHGCMGYDFCNGTEEAIREMAKYEASNGVTAICPASMTLAEEELERIFKTAAAYQSTEGALLCGINMEGPFISMEKKGAQNQDYIIPPSLEMFSRMQEAAQGMIRLTAIAPEQPEAMSFIQSVSASTQCSIAHTAADYETAMQAIQLGASHVTHFYNAMLPYSHRAPGVIGAVFDSEQSTVEMICDGIHIHPAVVRSTYKLLGRDRIALISDSMEATGLPAGQYTLGGQAVTVRENKATLADGTIAGSATNLMDCVRKAVKEMNIPLEDAIYSATIVPARIIGIDKSMGSVSTGKLANLVLLDEDLNIKKVFIKGKAYK